MFSVVVGGRNRARSYETITNVGSIIATLACLDSRESLGDQRPGSRWGTGLIFDTLEIVFAVLKTLWKPHKSIDQKFVHRSYTPQNFLNPFFLKNKFSKKYLGGGDPKILEIFRFSKISENFRIFQKNNRDLLFDREKNWKFLFSDAEHFQK